MIPLLLSLIPLLLADRILLEQKKAAIDRLAKAWLARTEPLAFRLQRSCTLESWVSRRAERIKHVFTEALFGKDYNERIASHSSPLTIIKRNDAVKTTKGFGKTVSDLQIPTRSDVELGNRLGKVLKQTNRAELLPAKLWAFAIDDPEFQKPPRLISGPGLESEMARFLQSLVREIGRCRQHLPTELFGAVWKKRARSIFGPAFSLETFEKLQEGVVLPVFFKGNYALLCWNFIDDPASDGQARGFFLLVQPIRPSDRLMGVRFCLEKWPRLARTTSIQPVFYDMPVPVPGRRRVWFPKRVGSIGRRQAVIRFVVSQIKNEPAELPLSKHISQQIQFEQWQKFFGRPKLLVERLNERLEIASDTWGRLVPLPPELGLGAMLIGPVPSLPLFYKVSRFLLWVIFAMIALLLLLRGWWFGDLPAPSFSVQAGLLIALLASIPTLVLLESAWRIRADLEETLLEQARQRLQQTSQAIEGRWSACLATFLSRVNALLSNPRLSEELLEIQTFKPQNRTWIEKAHHFLFPTKEDSGGVMIIGHGGFNQWESSFDYPSELMKPMLSYWSTWGGQFLQQISPDIARRYPTATQTSLLLTKLLNANASATNENLFAERGFVSIKMGSSRLQLLFRHIFHEGQVRFLLGTMWDPASTLVRDLRRTVPQISRRLGCELAVFYTKGAKKHLAAATESGLSDLHRIFSTFGEVSLFWLPPDHKNIVMIAVNPAIAGFTIVARLSLEEIQQRLAAENRRLIMLLVGLLVSIFTLGLTLIRWLVSPVKVMTHALERVTNEDLYFRITTRREDEVGQAVLSLDAMMGWLREKIRMQDFVSPQVLRVLRAGELRQALRGSRRSVVVLVSDIRSFTTLSEEYPAEIIFKTLNRHLQAMTNAIHAAGGVVDRFIGDAVQAAFFEAPDLPAPELAAVKAALGMLNAHRAIQRERSNEGLFTYQIGIGIQEGEVLTGVVGDPTVRLDFSMLGEPVTRAAELEAASKKAKNLPIIVSDGIRRSLPPGFGCQPLEGFDGAWELTSTTEMPLLFSPKAVDQARDSLDTVKSGVLSGDAGFRADTSKVKQENVTLPVLSADEMSWFDRWIRPALLIFIWISVIILSRAGRVYLAQDWREKVEVLERARFARDIALFGSEKEPADEISQDLKQSLIEIRRRLPSNADITIYLDRIARCLSTWQRRFPRMKWAVFEHQSYLDPSTVEPGNWSARLAFGNADFLFGEGERIVSHLSARISGFSLVKDGGWLEEPVIGGVKIPQWDLSMRRCYGRLGITRMLPNGVRFYWEPLPVLKVVSDETKTGAFLVKSQVLAAGNWSWQNLAGMVVVAIPEAELTQRQYWLSLKRNAKRRGIEFFQLAKQQRYNKIKRFRYSKPNCETNELVLRGKVTSLGITSRTYDVICRAKIGKGPAAIIHKILKGIEWFWLACTLIIVSWIAIFRHWPVFKLRQSLAGSLSFMFLPAIVVALAAIGARQQGTETQLLIDALNNLRGRLKKIELGSELYNAWRRNFLGIVVEHPRLRTLLAQTMSVMDEQKRADFLYQIEDMMQKLTKESFRYGLNIDVWRLKHQMGWSAAFPSERRPEVNISEADKMFRNGLIGTMLSNLEPLMERDSKIFDKNATKQIAEGYQYEEMQEMLNLIAAPTLNANLIFAPKAYIQLALGARNMGLFRWNMCLGKKPSLVGFLYWDREGDFQLLFNAMAMQGSESSLYLADRNCLQVFRTAPFWKMTLIDDAKRLENLVFGTSANSEIPLRAHQHGGEWWAVKGHGEEQRLLHAGICHRIDQFVFIQEKLIGQHRLAIANRTLLDLSFLVLVISSAFGLGSLLARLVLSPLDDLASAARQVMRGNFEVRLCYERSDEFGFLASAFNCLIQGVQEGRVLRQFVSESVRKVVSDDIRRRRSGAGERRSAVILFAGLAGFKSALAKQAPEKLVNSLNDYLEAMSRIIRSYGGEIDKFIGDKILAVFFPSDCCDDEKTQDYVDKADIVNKELVLSRSEAAKRALAVGAAMQAWVAKHGTHLPGPLGVGIVSGEVLSGILGVESVRLEYTVIGDSVNLASRLCDLALGRSGGAILLDVATYKALATTPDLTLPAIDIEALQLAHVTSQNDGGLAHKILIVPTFEEYGKVAVKGKRQEVEIYQLKY